jgi:hypothetical protein
MAKKVSRFLIANLWPFHLLNIDKLFNLIRGVKVSS